MSDKLIIVADSTQIEAFDTCERLWKYGHDERLTPARDVDAIDDKPALNMGTLGHHYMERYYKAQACHETQSNAIEYALAFNPDIHLCQCGESFEKHPAAVDNGTCLGWIAKPFPLEKPNRSLVAQRFREYCYTYSQTDIIPTSQDTVEVGFSELLYEDCEHMFILEGRIDLMGSLSGMKCVMDHKFQLREKRLYPKSIQFRNYAMVTGTSMLVLNMVRLAKGITNHTFERPIASFTSDEHKWWRKELISTYWKMADRRRSGTWLPTWSACAGKYGYECDFTKLCDPTNSPELLAAKKQTLYQIKPEWKPW